MRTRRAAAVLAFAILSVPAAARADGPNDAQTTTPVARDVKGDVPVTAYTYSAYGAPAGTVGAYGYGMGLAAAGQKASAGGGVTVWGSPIDRLTLVADALRDVYLLDHFAPSAAAIVRFLGMPGDGFSLGALGKYKVEGFGTDKNGDIESEVEGGLLMSYARLGFHLDANAITGFGLTDDGEIDSEGRLRLGYDVTSLVRLGVDGQGRFRLGGTQRLPGNRTWDFSGGPQLVVGTRHVFGSFTTGPTTMGITTASVVGWSAVMSVGASM